MIPYSRQLISDADIETVVRVLRSEFLTQGPKVQGFEEAVANFVGATYAVAVNSATSALQLACLALDLGPGDWLWTSPNSFVASANCALHCGASVDFVDIDTRTYNLCTQLLARKLEDAKKSGRLPKILVPVHFAGQPCDMERIAELAKEYDFRVVEDASHAIGGKWKGSLIGSCEYSDITVFSFHPVKIITTGEGGMLTTRNADLAQRLSDLRSHGITRDSSRFQGHMEGMWYYEQQSLGFNYRMTDIQAALGMSQMNQLPRFITRRHELVSRYERELAQLPIIRPWQRPESYSAFHLYPIQLAECSGVNRHTLFDQMRSVGIMVNVHYIPIHTQPFYQNRGFKTGDFPNAEAYYKAAISLPLHASLTEDEQDFVISQLKVSLL